MLFLYTASFSSLLLVLVSGSVCFIFSVGQCLVLTTDSSSFIFLFTLLSISVSVLTWSYYYMETDLAYRRFSGLILFFLVSMFTLVFSADLLSLFVAWDLLGFTSFFLVIFYRSRASIAGGLLTGLTNRVGDVFLLGLFGIVYYSSCTNMSWYLYFLLFISFTKSAQVPFSSWLPAAILAPTPVSALVHSSTLVTAGVYLLYRYSPAPSTLLILVGLFTTLIAGLSAISECDTKKIIALSTLRQLGLIVTSLGLGERSLCFAHLNTHAAFKALLFLAVGTAIHTLYGSQEVRSTVPLTGSSPYILIILVAASRSMCGLVFLSGWVTKEAILESRLNNFVSLFSLSLFYLGIGLTVIYSLRLIKLLYIPSVHKARLSASFSCSLIVKAPIFWLFRLSILQGIYFNFNCYSTPALLSWEDKFVVWGVFITRLIISHLLANFNSISNTPFTYLCLTTSFLRHYTQSASKLHYTEVSAFHGGGLVYLPSLVTPFSLGSHFFNKLAITLFIAFLIL